MIAHCLCRIKDIQMERLVVHVRVCTLKCSPLQSVTCSETWLQHTTCGYASQASHDIGRAKTHRLLAFMLR